MRTPHPPAVALRALLLLPLLLFLLLPPATTAAQVTLGARLGAGDGPNSHVTAVGAAGASLAPRLRAVAEVSGHSHFFWGCFQLWPDSFRCEYGGWSAHAGLGVAPLETDRVYVELDALAGVFRRAGSGGAWLGSWRWGGEAGVRVVGRTWLVVAHRRGAIDDPRYRELFDRAPRPRDWSFGLSVAFP